MPGQEIITPESIAADLYDYMTGLHDSGILDYPFSLDPKEQTISAIADDFRRGYYSGARDWLENASKQTGAPSPAKLLERLIKLEAWNILTDPFNKLDLTQQRESEQKKSIVSQLNKRSDQHVTQKTKKEQER